MFPAKLRGSGQVMFGNGLVTRKSANNGVNQELVDRDIFERTYRIAKRDCNHREVCLANHEESPPQGELAGSTR